MTQEDKELLLKDLSARLPYGVKFKADNEENIREIFYIKDENIYIREYQHLPYWIDNIKPFLRPMSSMTEEEKEEWYRQSHVDYDPEYKPDPTLSLNNCHLSINWLNAHHFDYQSLIPMGLALVALEGMYETKKTKN